MSSILHQPVTRRTLVRLALGAAIATLLLWGGNWIWGRITGRPPTTAQVRKQIWKFLREESRHDDFKVAGDWTSLTNYTLPDAPPASPSNTVETAPVAESALDKKELKLKAERAAKLLKVQAKSKRLPPIQAGYSTYFKTKQKEAMTYEAIYRFIGEELWVAEQMLAHTNSAMQQAGIILAGEAAHYAMDDAENGWLAARICEAYLWPSLDIIEKVEKPVTSVDNLLLICESAFRANDEAPSLVRNYEYIIRKSPKRADLARYRLALLHEQNQEWAKALQALESIKDLQPGKITDRVTYMKTRLKEKLAGR